MAGISLSHRDITGQRFGRWTVVSGPGSRKLGTAGWICRCDCGTERRVERQTLTSGRSKSCGCLFRENVKTYSRTHGGSETVEYRIWSGMIQRCSNPKRKAFLNYGGRGITVCTRWESFENFYADMGPRPSPKHSIDRIDNEGNYEPGNCRWATLVEQANNQRPRRSKSELEAIRANL